MAAHPGTIPSDKTWASREAEEAALASNDL